MVVCPVILDALPTSEGVITQEIVEVESITVKESVEREIEPPFDSGIEIEDGSET